MLPLYCAVSHDQKAVIFKEKSEATSNAVAHLRIPVVFIQNIIKNNTGEKKPATMEWCEPTRRSALNPHAPCSWPIPRTMALSGTLAFGRPCILGTWLP